MNYERIRAEALEKGFTDVQADAIIATIKARSESGKDSDYLLDYAAWKVGNYSAAKGGQFMVEAENIEQTGRAVNMLHATGKPIQLIDGHSSKTFLGGMPATRTGVNGKMRAALVGDPNTIAGIREGALGLSIEAKQFYSSEEYTKGEEFRYWPTAWAVLPVGTQQAVTPGEPLAAEEYDKNIPVRLMEAQETTPDRGIDPRKGDDMDKDKRIADLEAAEATKDSRISELEAGKVDLTAKLEAAEQKLVDIETAKVQADIEAAEKDAEKLIDEMVAKKLPGKREELKTDIMAAEGTDARLALMAVLDKNVPDMSAEEQKLNAGESTPEGKDQIDVTIEAADRRSKTEDISFVDALTEEINKGQE